MAGTVDVADVIDSHKVGRYQCLIAFMAWLTLFLARMGSIISVMFAGTMLALHWPLQTMYYLASIPMFFGCVWILILANVRAKTSRGAAEPKGRRAMA
jgi:hypothetical protein